MEKTKYEKLLEESAVAALENVINPFLKGKLTGKEFDRQKLSVSCQMVGKYSGYVATKMHNKGLNLIAIRMMSGGDREAAKTMIQKHFDKRLELPAPKG